MSLPQDRGYDKPGYRLTTEVVRHSDRRAAMLEMALRELEFFQQKYAVLSELAQVFEAVRTVRRKADKRRKKRSGRTARKPVSAA